MHPGLFCFRKYLNSQGQNRVTVHCWLCCVYQPSSVQQMFRSSGLSATMLEGNAIFFPCKIVIRTYLADFCMLVVTYVVGHFLCRWTHPRRRTDTGNLFPLQSPGGLMVRSSEEKICILPFNQAYTVWNWIDYKDRFAEILWKPKIHLRELSQIKMQGVTVI